MKKRILKLVLVVSIITLTVSCEAYNGFLCLKSVEREFPEAIKITTPQSRKYTFIVLDHDSNVYFVRTNNNTNANISHKELIFKH